VFCSRVFVASVKKEIVTEITRVSPLFCGRLGSLSFVCAKNEKWHLFRFGRLGSLSFVCAKNEKWHLFRFGRLGSLSFVCAKK